MNSTDQIILIYVDENGAHHEQPLSDITHAGTLIDDETGEDLELIGWRPITGQDYIVVDGGIIQNSPFLPVFDADILDTDTMDTDTVDDVVRLHNDIATHPSASKDWTSLTDRAKNLVTTYGTPEQQANLHQ